VGDLTPFTDWANVDLYYVDSEGTSVRIWEGMIASMDFDQSETDSYLTLSCIGALYQADLNIRAPRHLTNPRAYTTHINNEFANRGEAMRTQPLIVNYPDGWTLERHGNPWTGHETRESGAWDRPLTSWITTLLALMVNEDDTHWTLTKEDGRQPVLHVRNETDADATISALQAGVTLNLSRDLTQSMNVVFGEGKDQADSVWRNARIILTDRGEADTYYDPLAYDPEVWPYKFDDNPGLVEDKVRVETQFDFGGFDLDKAINVAEKMLARNQDPGWFGTITLKSDPAEIPRFLLKAGMNITLQDFNGTGETGILLHIAGCEVDFVGLSVTLTVDSKFRDRLTVEEALTRNRDSKTPSRLLQVNRESNNTNDLKEPWDYRSGSGFVPADSIEMWKEHEAESVFSKFGAGGFPYVDLPLTYPPSTNPDYYIPVTANAAEKKDRWTFTQIRVTEWATISSFELVAVNADGTQAQVSFHASFYSNEVGWEHMPFDANGPDPFLENAFRSPMSEDPPIDDNLAPDQALVIGWGDGDQKAGHWPGLESEGHPATGRLKDEGSWQYQLPYGEKVLWLAIYCDHTSPVYFYGRVWKGID
jgi:hypothetical protein